MLLTRCTLDADLDQMDREGWVQVKYVPGRREGVDGFVSNNDQRGVPTLGH